MNVRNNMFVASIPISVIAHRRVMFIGKTYCEKMTLNNICSSRFFLFEDDDGLRMMIVQRTT